VKEWVVPSPVLDEDDPSASKFTCSIGLLKTNTDGDRLAGAEFSLYGADGTLIERAVTGTDGIARFTKLPYGSYTVRETGAQSISSLTARCRSRFQRQIQTGALPCATLGRMNPRLAAGRRKILVPAVGKMAEIL